MAFQQAAPPKISIEIACRRTVNTPHPGLQAAVMGVDVLHVESALHPWAAEYPVAFAYAV